MRCEHCAGWLKPGRRSTIERTIEVHRDTCPGLLRLKRAAKPQRAKRDESNDS